MYAFDWFLLALFYLGLGNVQTARWMLRHPLSMFAVRELAREAPFYWGYIWFQCCVKWPFYVGK